jgi:hypothetical protein
MGLSDVTGCDRVARVQEASARSSPAAGRNSRLGAAGRPPQAAQRGEAHGHAQADPRSQRDQVQSIADEAQAGQVADVRVCV